MEGQHSLADIVIIGSSALNVDYLFSVDEFVSDGETFIKDFKKSPGGSASNTISALSKWGIPSAIIGCIGDDEDGELLTAHFRQWNVVQWISKVETHTGRAFIYVDKNGRRSSYIIPGANLSLKIDMFQQEIPESVKWVHCSSLVGQGAFDAQMGWLMELPERVRISFSPGMIYANYGLEGLKEILKKTTILFLSKDELEVFTGQKRFSIEDSIKILHDTGPTIVAVTYGKEGSYLSDGINIHHLKPFTKGQEQVEIIDTTGAGDAFAAGILFGLIKGEAIEKAHIRGTISASCVLRKYGALNGIPLRDEMEW